MEVRLKSSIKPKRMGDRNHPVTRAAAMAIGIICGILSAVIFNSYISYIMDPIQEAMTNKQTKDLLSDVSSYPEILQSMVIIRFIATVIGIIIGFLLKDYIAIWFEKIIREVDKSVVHNRRERFLWGMIGIIAGLVVAAFLIWILGYYIGMMHLAALDNPWNRNLLNVLILVLAVYFGGTITLILFQPEKLVHQMNSKHKLNFVVPKIFDTSAIIDGRIEHIIKTGFLDGVVIIPHGVLHELHSIADSTDQLKRSRGKRGLEILRLMRESEVIPVEIFDDSSLEQDFPSVDSRVVQVSIELEGVVVTTDYNLNQVAQLYNVKVLNVNDLSNALKPVVVPGEMLNIAVIKPGKEYQQGIGYLDDGTMVIIEGGEHSVGKTVQVFVTNITQTAAGRLIFTKVVPPDFKEQDLQKYVGDEYSSVTPNVKPYIIDV